VIVKKIIVEKQMECRLAAEETEVLGEKTCPSATFVHHKIPHDQTRVLNPGRRGGKPASNRLSYGAAKHEVNMCDAQYAIIYIYIYIYIYI
jgi:hypothetical protein